jgi:hypothetical protein
VQPADELPHRFADATKNVCCRHERLPLCSILTRYDATWRQPGPGSRTSARHFKRNAITDGRWLRHCRSATYGWGIFAVPSLRGTDADSPPCDHDERAFYCLKYERNYRSSTAITFPTGDWVTDGLHWVPRNSHTAGLRRTGTNVTVRRYESRSPRMPRITKATLAGRSPSRRMKYGNHWRPNGT